MSTKLSSNEKKGLLMQRFLDQCNAFKAKHSSYTEELNGDLIALEKMYGRDLVQEELGSIMLTGGGVVDSSSPGTNDAPKAAAGSPSAKARKSKTRRGSNKRAGLLSYTEVRPHVVEAVRAMTGTFTSRDVKARLKKKKIKFDPSHPSVILGREIAGIKKVGTEDTGKNIRPMNVFEIVGTVGLKKA